jgi:hypothetical protein
LIFNLEVRLSLTLSGKCKMTGFASMTSGKMQTWQQSGGAIAAFGTVHNDHVDQQPVAASGSGTGYINSCVRFEEINRAADQEISAAARTGPNAYGGCFSPV